MNSIAKLIKARSISFNEMMIRYYVKLNLNESEAMILMHLYIQQDEESSLLCPEVIKEKMSLNEQDLSNTILKLVQKGLIDLLIDESGKETFSLNPVIEKLGDVIDGTTEKTDEYDFKDLIAYIENAFGRVLNVNDLDLINTWFAEKYSVEEIKEAVLLSLRAKKTNIKYVDAILVNRHKEREKVEIVDDEMKQLLDMVYVKH